MTSEQFDALAVLMGQPDSKSAAAARLVLVEGLSSAEAARRVGITTQGANQAVQRCRRVIELAKVVGRDFARGSSAAVFLYCSVPEDNGHSFPLFHIEWCRRPEANS